MWTTGVSAASTSWLTRCRSSHWLAAPKSPSGASLASTTSGTCTGWTSQTSLPCPMRASCRSWWRRCCPTVESPLQNWRASLRVPKFVLLAATGLKVLKIQHNTGLSCLPPRSPRLALLHNVCLRLPRPLQPPSPPSPGRWAATAPPTSDRADPLPPHGHHRPRATRRQPLASQLRHFGALHVPGSLQHYPAQARAWPSASPYPGLSQAPGSLPPGPGRVPLAPSTSHQKTSPNTPPPPEPSRPPPPRPPASLSPAPTPPGPWGPPSLPLPAPPDWLGWAAEQRQPVQDNHRRTGTEGSQGGPTGGPGGAGGSWTCRPPWLLCSSRSIPPLGQVMHCPKCLLCLSALLTLLGLKVYIEWTSEAWLGKAYPGPPGTLPGPTPASPEPTLPANLSARLGQTVPLPSAYWNQQQWRLGALPSEDSSEAGDCRAWGNAAATEIPDFATYPEDLRRFVLSAACRSFPRWLPGSGSGQVASCTDTDAPYLLLAVKSEPGRFAERQAVRETWGGPAPGIRLLFLLGSPVGEGGPDLSSLVAWESRRHNDLLLWDFFDVPFNQTLKDLQLLAWLGRHCPGVNFVLLAQDDAFVRTHALLDHLQALPPSWARGLYLGEVFTEAKPLRKHGGPFYVPGSFYEGGYPAYASGGGYIIAGPLAPWLLRAAARVAPFPFNDVYTGLCVRALGLEPRAHKGFFTSWPADHTADPCTLQDLLLVRPLSPQDSIRLWKHLRDPQPQC
ncbi:UDP-GlcNAc:betaGal beta-1,3-N-acetylglucosaminyltransferase 8 isoform X3 [Manis pentadactyla]|uniref:UDP-GlcNAc:betaGal beta-1,3-N-acetylglucosaminyltransferase 8 isoform X3 n=1 Tax=Manis pentadactyla TaxID=143292 RepID=UPI00255CE59F|nr:UDP-GlcNAc:betaGal beta-1,3-N-acetylglucosaminyltransferase 8 isoform X3 [Manis pentadactyla]